MFLKIDLMGSLNVMCNNRIKDFKMSTKTCKPPNSYRALQVNTQNVNKKFILI